MVPAALPAAVLLVVAGPPPASIDFGSVELGSAARQSFAVRASAASASGAGFSATRTAGGVLVVFEPYERGEEATGVLTLSMRSGLVRVALRGRGIDTRAPAVTVVTPRTASAGRVLTIHFAATDNDLVRRCSLELAGHVIASVTWPATAFRWFVPRALHGRIRLTVSVVDRAGNHASASTKEFPISMG